MEASRHAYRCLPLSIANTHGWEILCPCAFSIHWNGGPEKTDIRFECHDNYPRFGRFADSNFARGIVTLLPNYIFRTEPGWNLLCTGPMNQPKDGISPLSGVVETDWLPYPFSMNWQLTRPGVVRFEKDEPFCLIYPVPQQVLEETSLEIVTVESDPELTERYRAWREQRDLFRVSARAGDEQAIKQAWQKNYFQAKLPGGQQAEAATHKQKLRLAAPVDLRPTVSAVRSAPVAKEGYATVAGGRIWYRVVGDGKQTPLVVVPGGPGFPHDYLETLSALADERPVVFYDPLGCGRSERPTDRQRWTIDQFAARLGQLCEALELAEVHLLGHGTGAAVAVERALAAGESVRSLVLASAA